MARRGPPVPPQAIDRWCQYAQGEVSHIAEATGFVNFELSYDGVLQRRTITPQHYIINFANRENKGGRPRYHSSFLTLRLAPEETLPEQVQVGVEVRGRDGESVVCGGEYVEFELLSLVNDASKQPSLRIAAGPVRVNPETHQREFMRIDLGRCVRQIVTDIIDDPKHKGQKLVRSRWWICVEVLRLVCSANSLDCSALDTPGTTPLEWVICLVDEKGMQSNSAEKSIDELAKFIDGAEGKKSKAKKKKKGKGDAAAGDDGADDGLDPTADLMPEGPHGSAYASLAALAASAASAERTLTQAALAAGYPPGVPTPSRAAPAARGQAMHASAGAGLGRPAVPAASWPSQVDPSALVDVWRDCAGCDVRHMAESTSFVHFAISFNREQNRRIISPVHYVIAFPHTVLGQQQRYHSALLTLRIVPESEIPDGTEGGVAAHLRVSGKTLERLGGGSGGAESIEFELLAREHEAPVQTPLRFTAGPVRINEKTGQRESMRLDLGECVRWAAPDFVEAVLDGYEQQLVRQRWWVCIQTLRLICIANSLDCSGLDTPGVAALEWVACLVDDRTPFNSRATELPGGMNAEHLRALADSLPQNGVRGDGQKHLDSQKPSKAKKKKAGESSEPAGATPTAAPTSHAPPLPAAHAKASTKDDQKSAPKAMAQRPPPITPPVREQRPPQTQTLPPQEVMPVITPAFHANSTHNVPEDADEPMSPMSAASCEDEFHEAIDPSEQEKLEEPKRPPAGKPPPPSRTLALPSALIDSWCQFARKNVTHVAEATGFVHFELNFDKERNRRVVSPEHYIIAFPNRDKGRQRYHSSLLTLRIVKESDIPADFVIPRPQTEQSKEDDVEYVEFELLLRVHEAPVQQQLRITAGPVRMNSATGQRESMRIDLGRCVRQISTDVVDDPRGKRVVRNRWWICVEMLRLVCTANSLDCNALDKPGHSPVEWVVCLVDERSLQTTEAQQPEEQRDIDELIDFIDGKGSSSKKKKKKKVKEKEDKEPADADAGSSWPSAGLTGGLASSLSGLSSAVGLGAAGLGGGGLGGSAGLGASPGLQSSMPSQVAMSASQAAAAAFSQAASAKLPGAASFLGGGPRADPAVQVQAAAQLLAEAAASCSTPEQAAATSAAAEAARRAAEAAASLAVPSVPSAPSTDPSVPSGRSPLSAPSAAGGGAAARSGMRPAPAPRPAAADLLRASAEAAAAARPTGSSGSGARGSGNGGGGGGGRTAGNAGGNSTGGSGARGGGGGGGGSGAGAKSRSDPLATLGTATGSRANAAGSRASATHTAAPPGPVPNRAAAAANAAASTAAANAAAASRAPLLASWEPTPLPGGSEAFLPQDASFRENLGAAEGLPFRAETASRALESLLAGLRSEFAEESGAAKWGGMNPDSYMASNVLS